MHSGPRHKGVRRNLYGALLAAAVAGGCWGGNDPPPGAGKTGGKASGTQAEKEKTVPPKPLLEGWPVPAAALVLTGEMHGYMEPCGCSETQSGGFARRGSLFNQLAERKWPVLPLDLGGVVQRPTRAQSKFKFEAIQAGLKYFQYRAMALGPEDLQLGPDELVARHAPDDLPFLCANVRLAEFEGLDLGLPVPARIVTVGKTTVGVTAILGREFEAAVQPEAGEGARPPYTFLDPSEALRPVLAEWERSPPDWRVLLSHARLEETQRVLADHPSFDLAVIIGPEDPDGTAKTVGTTLVVQVGQKGKYAGIVGLYPDDAARRLRWELVELDNRRFDHDHALDPFMREYQAAIADARLVAELQAAVHPSGAAYAGAKKCGECHTKAYNKWSTTGHSRAYESLEKGRKGQEAHWISRIHDPECLCCHTTGWNPQEVYPYEGGFRGISSTPHLAGQQCENCHGPGSEHVALEERAKKNRRSVPPEELTDWRKKLHLDLERARREVCIRCHDHENSPNFKFDEYWKNVVHPWRD